MIIRQLQLSEQSNQCHSILLHLATNWCLAACVLITDSWILQMQLFIFFSLKEFTWRGFLHLAWTLVEGSLGGRCCICRQCEIF